jgi:hypothetical protein
MIGVHVVFAAYINNMWYLCSVVHCLGYKNLSAHAVRLQHAEHPPPCVMGLYEEGSMCM